jgi:DNA-binding MarR family transcriptional regulator
MAKRGLVERVPDEEDRRSVRVRLTEHGWETIEGLIGPQPRTRRSSWPR